MALSLENKINLGFGLALLILIGIGLFSYWSITRIVETDKRHKQAEVVSLTLTTITIHLKDIAVGSRDYVITGQANYLAAYHTTLKLIEQDINALHGLSPVDIYSNERLGRLESPIRRKLSAIAHLVDLRRKEGFVAALDMMQRAEAELTLDDIHRVIDRMQWEEQILLEQRGAAQEASIRQAMMIVGGSSLMAVIVLLIAILVIKFDLMQRKKAEEVLRQTHLVVENSPAVLFQWRMAPDASWLLDFVSQNVVQFGYTAEELLAGAVDFHALMLPEDVERTDRELQAHFASGVDHFQQEYRLITKTGQIRWVDSRTVVKRDAEGRIDHTQDLILDMTERKQAEEALAQERNLLRTLLDNLPDSIYVKDTQGRHLIVNHATIQDTSAATMEEMLGKTDLELYSAEAAQQWYANDLAVIQSGQPLINQEEFSLNERGAVSWGLTSKIPLYDSHGKVMGLVGVTRDITERKQMEEALRQSEERFALAMQGSNDGIWDNDRVKGRVYFSPRLLELYGYAPAEFEPTFDWFVSSLHPDDKERTFAAIEAHLKERIPYDIEHRICTKSGEYRWVRNRGQAVWDESGRPVRMVGSTSDITERKHVEEVLRESEERFRQLAENIDQVFLLITPEHDEMIYLSPAYERVWGRTRQSRYENTHTFLDTVHPEDRERMRAALEEEGRGEYQKDYRIVRPDGATRWIRSRTFPVRNKLGEVYRIAGIAEDITERKQMEIALATERNLLRTIIDATPDFIFVKDQSHRFHLVNQAYAGLFQLTPEAVVGKTDLGLSVPADIVKGNSKKGIRGYWADDREVMDSGQAKYIAAEPFVINEQAHILSTVKVPLRDETNQVWGVLGFVHDITDLKRVQDELRQAKEVAESAARAKSEFLANMSHEIRTPLNAIIGMTSLLMDTSLSSEQQDFTETVRTSGDVLLTIINDILDFSKIEAGKLELEMQPFDLRQCIEESLDLVAIKAAEKKLDLAYLIDDTTPSTLVGDVTRLRQILVNLLNNAVKFTEQGEIVLSVSSHRLKHRPAEGQVNQHEDIQASLYSYEVHFAVRDTGIGIPADRMDRLFRSFSQVDASTTRKYGGTGLGLTISKRLTEMMGGEMWVESNGVPSEGATFHFSILAETAPDQPRVYLRGEQPQLAGKRLLIVDDNATNRLILARQTQSWGMLPRAASSGPEALAWISRNDPFDLVILDMQMPDMDGLSLALEIRRLEESRGAEGQGSGEESQSKIPNFGHDVQNPKSKIPLVILTSLGSREHNDQTAQVELAAFLTKPIKPSQLYNTLVGVFQGQPVKIKRDVARPALDAELGQRHPLRLLLAEDNTVNQKVALHMLERMGYRADVAANGLEALQALQRQAYDVVLMDMQMPEMDGLEATRAIHERWPVGERPRIIAMTANALQGDREYCLAAGMDDYISKPVRPEELAEALRRSQTRSGQAEPSSPVTRPLKRVGVKRPASETQPNQKVPTLEARALAELRELLGEESPKLIQELINIYLETAPPLLAEMRTALQNEDACSLHYAAHTLKPGSASLGAVRLAALCAELEMMGKTGQLQGAGPKLVELEAEFSQVVTALEIEKELAALMKFDNHQERTSAVQDTAAYSAHACPPALNPARDYQ